MEHATLESISIENSARRARARERTQTHTDRGRRKKTKKPPSTTWSVPAAVFSQNCILKGRADTTARTIIHEGKFLKAVRRELDVSGSRVGETRPPQTTLAAVSAAEQRRERQVERVQGVVTVFHLFSFSLHFLFKLAAAPPPSTHPPTSHLQVPPFAATRGLRKKDRKQFGQIPKTRL